MNWDRVAGNWRLLRGKVQEKWGKLTNDDLDVIDGQYAQLVGRIQRRYGLDRELVELEVQEWLESADDYV